jgi:hypothetical protein
MVPPVTEFNGPSIRLDDGSMLGIPDDILQQMDQLDIWVDTIKLRQGDAEGVALMRDSAKRALALYTELDAERIRAKRPHLAGIKAIDEFVAPFLKRLKTSNQRAKDKLAEFAAFCAAEVARVERERVAAEAAARAVEPAPGRVVPPLKVAVDAPELPDIPTQTRSELELYDVALIPREFLVPDRNAIHAALSRGATIPGARLNKVTKVVTR